MALINDCLQLIRNPPEGENVQLHVAADVVVLVSRLGHASDLPRDVHILIRHQGEYCCDELCTAARCMSDAKQQQCQTMMHEGKVQARRCQPCNA